MSTELFTDANRLAYIVSYEAQESSRNGPWAQRGSDSDEENDVRGAGQPGTSSSKCSWGESEWKERVKPIRRRYMTRSSFQEGYVCSRATERGTVHVIRYRVRSTDGKWRHKAETVNSPRRKDAERILAERLREVNRGLRLPVEISFSDFVEDLRGWTQAKVTAEPLCAGDDGYPKMECASRTGEITRTCHD
jgi:hypothetical protein